MTPRLIDLAATEMNRCAALLPVFDRLDPATIEVRCDLTGGSACGQCATRWTPGMPAARIRIRLHPGVYAAVGDAYRQTIAHEYAHAVVTARLVRDRLVGIIRRDEPPHGRAWRSLMRAFGYPPERSAAYDAAALAGVYASAGRVAYHCACPGKTLYLGPRQHAKAVAGTTSYRCPACRTSVRRASAPLQEAA